MCGAKLALDLATTALHAYAPPAVPTTLASVGAWKSEIRDFTVVVSKTENILWWREGRGREKTQAEGGGWNVFQGYICTCLHQDSANAALHSLDIIPEYSFCFGEVRRNRQFEGIKR